MRPPQGQAGKAGCCEHHLSHKRRGRAKRSISCEECKPKAKSRDICPGRNKKTLPQQAPQPPSLCQPMIRGHMQAAPHGGGHRGSGDICMSPGPKTCPSHSEAPALQAPHWDARHRRNCVLSKLRRKQQGAHVCM